MKFKKLITGITSFLLIGNIFLVSGATLAQATEISNNEVVGERIQNTETTEPDLENISPLMEENETFNTFSVEETTETSSEDKIVFSEEVMEEATEESLEEHTANQFTSPNPEIQELLNSLTSEDLENAVGEDGLGEKEHTNHEPEAFSAYSDRSYENVNNYIKRKGFKNPKISKDPRFGTTPKLNYKIGRPIGVVVHETANPNSTINGEVNYMYNNQRNAFVHAFTDRNQVIETAPTDFLAWGAGPNANPFFMHIELVQSHNFDDFARSVNNDAFWISTQLKRYNLTPTLADTNNGVGSVISHNAISKYYGGTNHTDPTGYFARWGYDMNQFFQLIEYHYYQGGNESRPKEPENYEIFDRDVSIKPSANFNIHSKPYPYEGFKVIGNTKASQGKQVHVNMKAKSSVATYYNVEGLGWIDARAFTSGLDTVTKKTFNRRGKIQSSQRYSFYKEPYNTKGAYRLGPTTQPLFGQDVEITQQAVKTNSKEVFYLVKNNGWVPAAAFSAIYDEENIKNISKDVSIKPNATGSVFTRPYSYAGYELKEPINQYRGKQVHISQEAKTRNGIYYLVDTIGWVHTGSLTTSLDTLTKKKFNGFAKINNKKTYNFYKEPYNTKGSERTGNTTKPLYNKDVEITQEATVTRTKEKLYFVKDQGWLTSAALSLYPAEKIKSISKDVSIKPNAGGSVFSKPYTYYGSEKIEPVNAYRGKQVHLSKEAQTNNGIYFLVDDIGWVHTNALTDSLDVLSKKSITQYAKIQSNKTYNFYKEPYNTLGSERTGKTTKPLYNQDVEIIEEGLVSRTKEKLYHVKDHGWLTSAALSLYPKEETTKISKDVSIKPNAGGSIFSKPYTYFGFEKTGLVKDYRGKQVHLSQEAKTKNGIYYLVEDIGWIHVNSFTTSLDSVTKKNIQRDAKIKSNKTYSFYKEPYNTLGSERTGKTTKPLYNKDVKISQEAVVARTKEKLYYVENQGWLTSAALTLYDAENIKSISKDLTIKPNAVGSVFSKPYPYFGVEKIELVKGHRGKQVHLSQEGKSSNGTYYLADNIGWIHISAFTDSLDTVSKQKFQRDARVYNKTYSFYTEPFNTLGSMRNGKTTNPIKEKDVVVTEKAVSKKTGTVYYLVKNYGWIDQKALLIYDVPNYEKINMRLQIKSNAKYNVHTQPYPYKGFKVIGDTKSMKMTGKTYNVYKLAHTSKGVYYEVSGYGWINRDAFQKARTVSAFLETDRNRVNSHLSSHENDRYYLTTPYRSVIWFNDPNATMSPLGAPNGYGPGMNCTGFVAFAMKQSGGKINKVTQEANAWGGISNAYNWRDALKKNTDYSTFRTVNELLSSGKAKKGDILYFEPNYSYPDYDCHIGFFWGNNSKQNKQWHSASPSNKISNIYAPRPFTMIYLFPMD